MEEKVGVNVILPSSTIALCSEQEQYFLTKVAIDMVNFKSYFPSNTRLQELLTWGKGKLQKVKASLKQKGVLYVRGRVKKDGGQSSNIYAFNPGFVRVSMDMVTWEDVASTPCPKIEQGGVVENRSTNIYNYTSKDNKGTLKSSYNMSSATPLTNDKSKKKQVLEKKVDKVILMWNEVTGGKYPLTGKKTRAFIRARLKEGYTFEDMKKVVEDRVLRWKNNAQMKEYLRISTVFSEKFIEYHQCILNKSQALEDSKLSTNEREAYNVYIKKYPIDFPDVFTDNAQLSPEQFKKFLEGEPEYKLQLSRRAALMSEAHKDYQRTPKAGRRFKTVFELYRIKCYNFYKKFVNVQV